MKRKTAIYCRSALYDEIAVARQEAQCREYTHTLGIDDADITVYRDCGASGVTLGRPAMNALTEDVEAGKIGAVIASDMARIARNFALSSEWRELLRAYGVKLVTLAERRKGNRRTTPPTPNKARGRNAAGRQRKGNSRKPPAIGARDPACRQRQRGESGKSARSQIFSD